MNLRLSRTLGLTVLAIILAGLVPFVTAKPKADDNIETFEKLATFADAFAMVRDNYVEDIEDADLVTNAINGALESLDPHSHFVPYVEFQERQKTARREYGGLGIEVTMENELVKVNYVISGGPADKSGILKNDYITAVEGSNVRGKTLSEAVDGMRGLAGDPITVTVLTEGRSPRDVTVIRENVQGRAVRHRMEEGIGYIYIETFNHPRLAQDTKTAIEDLQTTQGGTLRGLIVDVRGNPGGRVDQTVKVADLFLSGGEVFSARGRTQQDTQRYNAKDGQLLDGVPIVVMINSNSASAAEILAGAIQDRGRGIIVGRRSFGKGSVQSVIELENRTGALRLTTQRYFTPSGKSIQGRGIMPDVLVAFRPDTGSTRKVFRENSLRNALQNPKYRTLVSQK
jgi:carboxyl-terminal processing protease